MVGVRAPMHDAEEPVIRPYLLVEDIQAAWDAALVRLGLDHGVIRFHQNGLLFEGIPTAAANVMHMILGFENTRRHRLDVTGQAPGDAWIEGWAGTDPSSGDIRILIFHFRQDRGGGEPAEVVLKIPPGWIGSRFHWYRPIPIRRGGGKHPITALSNRRSRLR